MLQQARRRALVRRRIRRGQPPQHPRVPLLDRRGRHAPPPLPPATRRLVQGRRPASPGRSPARRLSHGSPSTRLAGQPPTPITTAARWRTSSPPSHGARAEWGSTSSTSAAGDFPLRHGRHSAARRRAERCLRGGRPMHARATPHTRAPGSPRSARSPEPTAEGGSRCGLGSLPGAMSSRRTVTAQLVSSASIAAPVPSRADAEDLPAGSLDARAPRQDRDL